MLPMGQGVCLNSPCCEHCSSLAVAATAPFRVRILQLSGALLGESELAETARIADVLATIQHNGVDPVQKLGSYHLPITVHC